MRAFAGDSTMTSRRRPSPFTGATSVVLATLIPSVLLGGSLIRSRVLVCSRPRGGRHTGRQVPHQLDQPSQPPAPDDPVRRTVGTGTH